MPYIQNTDEDRSQMLASVGVDSVDRLFDCIPEAIRLTGELPLPPSLSEPEMMSQLRATAARNLDLDSLVCFAGGGIYDHYVPPVVDFVANRSEFYTSYTPYQAEASQGNLQVFYEYQTLICKLTGMDVANASLYDGASALAESVLMATNIARRDRVLVSAGVHPEYRETLRTYLRHLNAPWDDIPAEAGATGHEQLEALLGAGEPPAVVVVQQPTFFGSIEDLRALTEIAHQAGALVIAVVNPIALGLLKAPGDCGADIVCGEGQCLGIPPSLGGPGIGIMATREEYVRKIPGRIVGQTGHANGERAFVLTLQTREQHIRREKATSNICTNHALLALRAAVYLCTLGKRGLVQVAALCAQKAHLLSEVLERGGYAPVYAEPFFNEFVVDCGRPAEDVVEELLGDGYLAGIPLGRFCPQWSSHLLISVTEQRSLDEIEDFSRKLADRLEAGAG